MGSGGPMGPRAMTSPGPGGGRMQVPPPPYPAGRGGHPGQSMSPNPNSPATSLPVSSPGAGMINSPRPMGSNPGTPVSGPPLSSPVLGKNSPEEAAMRSMAWEDKILMATGCTDLPAPLATPPDILNYAMSTVNGYRYPRVSEKFNETRKY